MAFGQKTGSLKNLKKSLAKGGGGGGTWIKYIPKNGVMNVRFIQEPEEWSNYIEHFDTLARKSFPCSGESNCPGCASSERKTSRYLANAVDLDDKNRVIPLQLPKDLANRLVVKYEKWGTLTDRDIELSRTGEGLDTVYDLEAEAPTRMNLEQFVSHDLEKILEEAYNNVFGESPSSVEDEAPVAPKPRKKSAAAQQVSPGPVADEAVEIDTDDSPDPVFTPDVEPDEPVVEEVDEDDDDEEVYDEDMLRAMPLGVLRRIARDDYGVVTKGLSQEQLVDAILDAGEEADEEA